MSGVRCTVVKGYVAESRARVEKRSAKLAEFKQEMTALHRKGRTLLVQRQNAEWLSETIQRACRLPKGLRNLWHRLTGHYQDIRRQNETEAEATGNGMPPNATK